MAPGEWIVEATIDAADGRGTVNSRSYLVNTEVDSRLLPCRWGATVPSRSCNNFGLSLMSKDFSLNPYPEATRSVNAHAIRTSLVEANAEQLMDELFQDLEQTLAPDSTHPTLDYLAAAWPDPATTLDIAQPPQTATLLPHCEEEYVPYTDLDDELDFLIPQEFDAQTQPSRHPWPSVSLNSPVKRRLLFGAACTSLLAATCVWIGNQFPSEPAMVLANAPQASSVSAPQSADAQFAEYVLRSLDRIDQQASGAKSPLSTPAALTNAAVAALPAVPKIEISPPSEAGARTTTPDRVFVPAARNPLPKPQLTPVNPPAKASTSSSEHAAAAVPQSPALPMAGSDTPSQQVLKGVMDLGNQSVALVESNGSTRRVQMGEPLDDKGLTLVEVQSGKAMVQNGSEVRSLSVGDRF